MYWIAGAEAEAGQTMSREGPGSSLLSCGVVRINQPTKHQKQSINLSRDRVAVGQTYSEVHFWEKLKSDLSHIDARYHMARHCRLAIASNPYVTIIAFNINVINYVL